MQSSSFALQRSRSRLIMALTHRVMISRSLTIATGVVFGSASCVRTWKGSKCPEALTAYGAAVKELCLLMTSLAGLTSSTLTECGFWRTAQEVKKCFRCSCIFK